MEEGLGPQTSGYLGGWIGGEGLAEARVRTRSCADVPRNQKSWGPRPRSEGLET